MSSSNYLNDPSSSLQSSRMASSSHNLRSSSTMGASSRPFLNLLNPMGRHYRGYQRANDVVEEEEEEDYEEDENAANDNDNANEGRSKRSVSWGRPGTSSERHVLQTRRDLTRHAGDTDGEEEDDDGEVPQSFLIEAAGRRPSLSSKGLPPRVSPSKPPKNPTHLAVPNHPLPFKLPSRPSELEPPPLELPTHNNMAQQPMRGLDAYERALWNWVNVSNLDAYLQEVYAYYAGKGIYCIALSRGLNLLTVGFVISFSTFLLGCIDYSKIPVEGTSHLSDAIVEHCVSKFSGFTLLFFLSFGAFYLWYLVSFGLDMIKLVDMYKFYTHLLGVPDADVQTISWPEIVRRIGAIRDSNPNIALSSGSAGPSDSVTAPLDAHDIANRIMRQENYLIALFNKELLDLSVPMPAIVERFLGSREDGRGKTLTRALEWNLRFCLMGHLFDPYGKVRRKFLDQRNKEELVIELRRRFLFMGILNAIFAPFLVIYLIMYSFFRYFEEYHKNPSSIGGRNYTPYAQWKFREFNELPHLFKRRLRLSYPKASEYLDQFPKEKISLIMRFVAFVAGSFAAVLVLASIIDPDLFLHFEITPHRTVLFYLGVFGSILAVARGMIPDDHVVFDPEMLLREVVHYTHYMPAEWKGQLHSQMVHTEFGHLFEMKITTFAQELLSVVLTPFVLWFSLPPCSTAIVDFFREFSVHVDGLGYVCSFAVFDFKRHGNVHFGAPTETTDERYQSKEGKMEKSFLNFKAAHPDWNPTDPSGSMYLSRMADLSSAIHPHAGSRSRSGGRRGTVNASSLYGYQGDRDQSRDSSEQKVKERAMIYDRALQKSISASAVRKRVEKKKEEVHAEEEEAVEGNGEVISELGDSYADGGTKPKFGADGRNMEVEEEELANGGMIGLLTQIYNQRGQVM